MAKNVTITVYELSELKGAARARAESLIEARIIENENIFVQDVRADFERKIDPCKDYRWDDLPDGWYLESYFKESRKYHGANRGDCLRVAFDRFLSRYIDDFYPTEEAVLREAEDCELLFYEDGSIFCEE